MYAAKARQPAREASPKQLSTAGAPSPAWRIAPPHIGANTAPSLPKPRVKPSAELLVSAGKALDTSAFRWFCALMAKAPVAATSATSATGFSGLADMAKRLAPARMPLATATFFASVLSETRDVPRDPAIAPAFSTSESWSEPSRGMPNSRMSWVSHVVTP